MNRPWLLRALLLVVVFYLIDAAVTQLTLADLAENPPVLVQGEQRLQVWIDLDDGRPQPEGTAAFAGGYGVFFGYRVDFDLPDAGRLSCTKRLRWLWCDGGWRAERD